MLVLNIVLLITAAIFTVYHFTAIAPKKALSAWLQNISAKYGIHAHDVDFFHRKLVAYDSKRAVIVLLDKEDGEETGHIIGIDEITNCELVVHETNKEARSHNIDRIDLELTLKTGNKQVNFPLYRKNFPAIFYQKQLKIKALDWYEKLSAITQKEAEAVSRIA